MVEFFRHCPGCGQRFHVKLENIEKIRDEKKIVRGKPIVVEEKEFEYTYRCDYCGHEWTEHHEKIHKEHTNPTVEFFGHCPGCGRQSDIILERKERTSIDQKPLPAIGTHSMRVRGARLSPPVAINADLPAMLKIEEFQYYYKCKHCGHEWTEHQEKIRRER